jgi:hypothetical protein
MKEIALLSGLIIKTAPTDEGRGRFYRKTVISSAIEAKHNLTQRLT